jgi:hypothetical protein
MGNIGLMVRGIEIYLPLSPNVSLAMFCPSLREGCLEKATELSAAEEPTDQEVGTIYRNFAELLAKQGTLTVTGDIVDNHNALQANQAERHVFGDKRELGIVEKVVRQTQRYHAPRPSRL